MFRKRRVVICVFRTFCSTDQEKRETARSLKKDRPRPRVLLTSHFSRHFYEFCVHFFSFMYLLVLFHLFIYLLYIF